MSGVLKRVFLFVVILIFSIPRANAGEITYGIATVSQIKSVYDGDTFRADIAGWPDIIGKNIPVRVAGVDTPEINGQCEAESQLAIQARNTAATILQSGEAVVLLNLRRGKYFRIVADVWVGNINLAMALITQRLGRPYYGGKRKGWCDG